ncbi:hypothetical protein SAMN05421827_109130 [Pedobacter terrae]|uniref:Uncharacterized protein n=1 Tax=Pedobacter terrae TaxID=405671 RepID=A0A1G7W785_9SPHI|nr:hypothetical protein [Pedobacter terrae]SDG67812.1 hypothetical protein SAMN05421827_109130 [Pedobacter terrae]
MAIASLTSWLNDPNRTYEHGKLLYDQYGDNKSLSALFKSGSTSFHLSKLTAALAALNLKANLEPKPIIILEAPEPEPSPEKMRISYDSAPDQIIQILEKKRFNYAKARRLFEAVRVMDSQQHRLDAAIEILDLMDEVNEAWAIIDEWNDTGHLREQEQKQVVVDVQHMSLQQLLKEKANLGPNISKDRKKLKVADSDKSRLKITQRIEAREARYKLVLERIDGYAI